MSASADPVDVTVIARVPKVMDQETHIRIIRVNGVAAIEFRDFIPSTQTYGPGYWIPATGTSVEALREGLARAGAFLLDSTPVISPRRGGEHG